MKSLKLMMMTLMMCLFLFSCNDNRSIEISNSVTGKTFVVYNTDDLHKYGEYSILTFNKNQTYDYTTFFNGKIDKSLGYSRGEKYKIFNTDKEYKMFVDIKEFHIFEDNSFYCNDAMVVDIKTFTKNHPHLIIKSDK